MCSFTLSLTSKAVPSSLFMLKNIKIVYVLNYCEHALILLDNMSCIQYNIIMNEYVIEYLILPNGKAPIIEWLNALDSGIRKRITQRILRIEDGNFGDFKKLSEDISELRFNFGKGYRIYYTEIDYKIVLLINGGDKSKQSKDIQNAQELLKQWRHRYD